MLTMANYACNLSISFSFIFILRFFSYFLYFLFLYNIYILPILRPIYQTNSRLHCLAELGPSLFLTVFFSHYSELIKVFGPPIAYWTGRFEAKHRIAKESIKKKIKRTISSGS